MKKNLLKLGSHSCRPRAEQAVVREIAGEICLSIDEAETKSLLNLLARPPKLNAAACKAAALAADVVIRP